MGSFQVLVLMLVPLLVLFPIKLSVVFFWSWVLFWFCCYFCFWFHFQSWFLVCCVISVSGLLFGSVGPLVGSLSTVPCSTMFIPRPKGQACRQQNRSRTIEDVVVCRSSSPERSFICERLMLSSSSSSSAKQSRVGGATVCQR